MIEAPFDDELQPQPLFPALRLQLACTGDVGHLVPHDARKGIVANAGASERELESRTLLRQVHGALARRDKAVYFSDAFSKEGEALSRSITTTREGFRGTIFSARATTRSKSAPSGAACSAMAVERPARCVAISQVTRTLNEFV